MHLWHVANKKFLLFLFHFHLFHVFLRVFFCFVLLSTLIFIIVISILSQFSFNIPLWNVRFDLFINFKFSYCGTLTSSSCNSILFLLLSSSISSCMCNLTFAFIFCHNLTYSSYVLHAASLWSNFVFSGARTECWRQSGTYKTIYLWLLF